MVLWLLSFSFVSTHSPLLGHVCFLVGRTLPVSILGWPLEGRAIAIGEWAPDPVSALARVLRAHVARRAGRRFDFFPQTDATVVFFALVCAFFG